MQAVRRLTAQALVVATGAGISSTALSFAHGPGAWMTLTCGALVAAGGVLLGTRSMSAQIVGRAAAWSVLAPTAVGVIDRITHGHLPHAGALAMVLATSAALVLARPMIDSPEARRAFGPKALRRWLIGASTGAMAFGTTAALAAVFTLFVGHAYGSAAGLGLVGAVSIASALGVIRMRSWGVLLGALGSFGMLAWAAFFASHGSTAFMMACGAVPGIMMAAGVAASRAGLVTTETEEIVRVGAFSDRQEDPRVRIAMDAGELAHEEPAMARMRA